MEPDDYLLDENTPEFEKAFERHLMIMDCQKDSKRMKFVKEKTNYE